MFPEGVCFKYNRVSRIAEVVCSALLKLQLVACSTDYSLAILMMVMMTMMVTMIMMTMVMVMAMM